MANWALETAEWIQQETRKRAAPSAEFVEKQRLRRDVGPQLWKDLRANLKEECEELKREVGAVLLGFEVCPIMSAKIRRMSDGAVMDVEYRADLLRITWKIGSATGYFLFRVNEDGTVGFETSEHKPLTLNGAASLVLDWAVGKSVPDSGYSTPLPYNLT